jgi:hypothetical protein
MMRHFFLFWCHGPHLKVEERSKARQQVSYPHCHHSGLHSVRAVGHPHGEGVVPRVQLVSAVPEGAGQKEGYPNWEHHKHDRRDKNQGSVAPRVAIDSEVSIEQQGAVVELATPGHTSILTILHHPFSCNVSHVLASCL